MNDAAIDRVDATLEDQMRFWRSAPGVRRAYADSLFGQLHYRIARPAKPTRVPLLCFHLSPNSGRLYNILAAEMGKDRIVIAPDTPGFGESDAPVEPPEIADYAATMGDLMDQLGIREFDVMGYHTGSRTCVEIAQQRPDQVRRVVLVSAPIYTEEDLAEQRKTMGTPAADEIATDGAHLQRKWNGHRRWSDKAAPLIFLHREVTEALRGGATAWWGHRAAFRLQHADNLPKVKQPVMVLCPNDDLWTHTQRARPYLQNGIFVELPDYAHGFLDVHTADVAKRLRGFLDTPFTPHDGTATARKDAPPRPKKHSSPIRRAFLDGPYGQLHYRIVKPANPARVPLVCFHMSPNSGRIWEALLAEMGRDRIAAAPDTPGFGESDAPSAPPEIADYARTMAGFIEKLGLRQVDLIGYHTGSMTVIELALQRPDLVRRIVQVSSPIFTKEEVARHRALYAPPAIEPDGAHLVKKWRHMLPFYGPKAPLAVVARNFAEGLRGGPVSHWGHRAAFNYDLAAALPRCDKPILVLNPNDDLWEQTPRARSLMKNGRIHDIPDHSHGFIDTITADVGRWLRDFLDKA
jgi:pimeloyl-ACP methyl ester carboxylesterase